MTTVICGQLTDLPYPNDKIVIDFIKFRWPLSGFTPAKNSITFSRMGYLGYRDYQISVQSAGPPIVTPLSIGPDRIEKYTDPINIHVWVRKNMDDIPTQLYSITQKIEDIINSNVTSVGYGITSIRLTSPFSVVEISSFLSGNTFKNETEQSLFHMESIAELMYFKSITSLTQVLATKTHKYNVID
jgi:hypothetical protein